jgi:hypothetical protein
MAGLDFDTVQELQGEVVRLSWRNPHVELTLGVTDENGDVVHWEIEAQDINTMSRRGLTKELLNEGEIIRVAGHPHKFKARVMSVTNLLLPNGTEIRFRGNPKPRWEKQRTLGFGNVDVEKLLATVDTEAGKAKGLFRVWMRARRGGFPAELPLTEAALSHQRNWVEADDPNLDCTVPGMPPAMRLTPPHPIDFIEQKDGNILLRIEFFDIVRTIHMNADVEPQDQPASAQGYSVGRWEDDVLVVNTSRVNWPYFDNMATIPLSETAEMYERFEISEDGTQMDYSLVVTDSSTFTEPVTGRWLMDWRPDLEMQKYDCIPPEGHR